MWGMSIVHWGVVLILVTVLFGRNKVSSAMQDLGAGLREFKKGVREATTTETRPEALPDFSEPPQSQAKR